jgi:tetratricopeptide (TPR) repeat protein
VLELPSTATADQVKQAYLEQAKRFHPDRLPALGLDELRPVADQLFRKIGEAFAILSDTRRRAEYQLGLARPEVLQAQQAARTLVDAELAFRKGEALLNRGDLAGALVEFDQALAANPTEPDHIGAQLWARVCLQQVPVAAAKTKLNELTQSAPKSARCWYWLGLCYRELGDLPRAIAALIKARELDGRLVGLDSELRALQMRKEKSSPATGGLFSRLRKK